MTAEVRAATIWDRTRLGITIGSVVLIFLAAIEALAVTTYLTGLGEWQQLMVGAARGLVLADRGLVRMARVVLKRAPVQGGGRTLRLDDAEMRVTSGSALSRDSGRWRPTPEIVPGGPIGTIGGAPR